eukprot:gene4727-5781_t
MPDGAHASATSAARLPPASRSAAGAADVPVKGAGSEGLHWDGTYYWGERSPASASVTGGAAPSHRRVPAQGPALSHAALPNGWSAKGAALPGRSGAATSDGQYGSSPGIGDGRTLDKTKALSILWDRGAVDGAPGLAAGLDSGGRLTRGISTVNPIFSMSMRGGADAHDTARIPLLVTHDALGAAGDAERAESDVQWPPQSFGVPRLTDAALELVQLPAGTRQAMDVIGQNPEVLTATVNDVGAVMATLTRALGSAVLAAEAVSANPTLLSAKGTAVQEVVAALGELPVEGKDQQTVTLGALKYGGAALTASSAGALRAVMPALSRALGGADQAAEAVRCCPELLTAKSSAVNEVHASLVEAFGGHVAAARSVARYNPALLAACGADVTQAMRTLEGAFGGAEQARQAVCFAPGALAVSGHVLAETVMMLEEVLPAGDSVAPMLLVMLLNPSMLGSPPRLLSSTVHALVDVMGSAAQAAAALGRAPGLLRVDGQTIRNAHEAWSELYTGPRAMELLEQSPMLLGAASHVVRDSVPALTELLGDTSAVLDALCHLPALLQARKGALQQAATAVVAAVGGAKPAAAEAVRCHPELLAKDGTAIARASRAVAAAVGGQEQMVEAVTRHPQLLTNKPSNLECVLAELGEAFGGTARALDAVAQCPALLEMKASSIKQAMAALEHVVGNAEMAVAAACQHPLLLTAQDGVLQKMVPSLVATLSGQEASGGAAPSAGEAMLASRWGGDGLAPAGGEPLSSVPDNEHASESTIMVLSVQGSDLVAERGTATSVFQWPDDGLAAAGGPLVSSGQSSDLAAAGGPLVSSGQSSDLAAAGGTLVSSGQSSDLAAAGGTLVSSGQCSDLAAAGGTLVSSGQCSDLVAAGGMDMMLDVVEAYLAPVSAVGSSLDTVSIEKQVMFAMVDLYAGSPEEQGAAFLTLGLTPERRQALDASDPFEFALQILDMLEQEMSILQAALGTVSAEVQGRILSKFGEAKQGIMGLLRLASTSSTSLQAVCADAALIFDTLGEAQALAQGCVVAGRLAPLRQASSTLRETSEIGDMLDILASARRNLKKTTTAKAKPNKRTSVMHNVRGVRQSCDVPEPLIS